MFARQGGSREARDALPLEQLTGNTREKRAQAPVKRHRGEPGRTHGTHTWDQNAWDTRDTSTWAHGSHRRTSQPSKPNEQRHIPARPAVDHAHDHATAETAADSTAAGPEPTAPRGRLTGIGTFPRLPVTNGVEENFSSVNVNSKFTRHPENGACAFYLRP